jgi:hypothetical protein
MRRETHLNKLNGESRAMGGAPLLAHWCVSA